MTDSTARSGIPADSGQAGSPWSSTPDEARRTLALTLAVELRSRSARDIPSGYVTRTARAFEAYLRDGTVER